MSNLNPFGDLSFDQFRELALNPNLSRHEKVGFPNSYREGKEADIFTDILSKVGPLHESGKTVLEIGPGCSNLPRMLAEHCLKQNHRLLFVDSAEMLQQLPDAPHIEKMAGRFPCVPALFERFAGKIDAAMAYSVIQYSFKDGSIFEFLDRSLELLAPGGRLLLGDIPNATMRKRFFASEAGICCHKNYTGRDELPEVVFNHLSPGEMDDAVVLALLARARAAGFQAWVVPQAPALPMSNRREDILIHRP